jgi:hypothetical protein
MNWWWDTYLDVHDLWGVYRPFASVVAKLDLRDPDLVPITPNASGALRLIGWASPRQALLMPHLRDDTWYRTFVLEQPRPAMSIAMPIRLGGFISGRTYAVATCDMLTGVVAIPVPVRANSDGVLDFSLAPGQRDVVWWVHLTADEK